MLIGRERGRWETLLLEPVLVEPKQVLPRVVTGPGAIRDTLREEKGDLLTAESTFFNVVVRLLESGGQVLERGVDDHWVVLVSLLHGKD